MGEMQARLSLITQDHFVNSGGSYMQGSDVYVRRIHGDEVADLMLVLSNRLSTQQERDEARARLRQHRQTVAFAAAADGWDREESEDLDEDDEDLLTARFASSSLQESDERLDRHPQQNIPSSQQDEILQHAPATVLNEQDHEPSRREQLRQLLGYHTTMEPLQNVSSSRQDENPQNAAARLLD